MAMENSSITQHRETLRYAHICSGAYWSQLQRFPKRDYVYLQREALTTLDVKTGCTILRVKDVLRSDISVFEGKDGQEYQEHSKNCAPAHLPFEGFLHLNLVEVKVFYFLFMEKNAATMLLSDTCQPD